MSKPKHTKGPWRIERRVRTAIYAGKKHIAMVGYFKTGDPETCISDQEHEANVSLIIAAPCLLEAIEAYLGAECPDSVQRAVDMMETAVKRAKGGAE